MHAPDILVIGTGYFGFVKVSAEVKEHFEDKGIELIIHSTRMHVGVLTVF